MLICVFYTRRIDFLNYKYTLPLLCSSLRRAKNVLQDTTNAAYKKAPTRAQRAFKGRQKKRLPKSASSVRFLGKRRHHIAGECSPNRRTALSAAGVDEMRSMMEQADTCKRHCNAKPVAGLNHLVVPDRATGLRNRRYA